MQRSLPHFLEPHRRMGELMDIVNGSDESGMLTFTFASPANGM